MLRNSIVVLVAAVTIVAVAALLVFESTAAAASDDNSPRGSTDQHHLLLLRQLLADDTAAEEEDPSSFSAFLSQWIQLDPDTISAIYGSSNNNTTIQDAGDDDVDAEGNIFWGPLCTFVIEPLFFVVVYPLFVVQSIFKFVGLEFLGIILSYPFYPVLVPGFICRLGDLDLDDNNSTNSTSISGGFIDEGTY